MKTVGALILIIIFVSIAYLMMMMLQPTTNALVATANTSSNWTNFPGSQEVIVGWPFWSYLIPGALGLIMVVAVLRQGKK